jgi:hypothetical protein
MQTTATTIVDAVAEIESISNIQTNNVRVRFNSSGMSATSNSSIAAVKTARVISVQSSTAQFSVVDNRLRDNSAVLTTTVTQSTVAIGFKNFNCNMQSVVYDFTCSPTFIVRIDANLTAFNAQLTAGRIIHLDPLLTWRIEPETRYLKINDESRVYMIEQETRIIKIKGYVL